MRLALYDRTDLVVSLLGSGLLRRNSRYVGCADAEKLTSVTVIRNDGLGGARKRRHFPASRKSRRAIKNEY